MRKTFNGSPGLWTAPNSEIAPPGALERASGAIIRRAGLIQSLTPMRQYNLTAFGSGTAGFFLYNGGFIVRTGAGGTGFSSETSAGGANFAALTLPTGASAAPVDSSDVMYVRNALANGNAYVSTSKGFLRFSALNSNPRIAGMPRALDVQLSLVATGTLLASGQSVGYRVVFGVQDANKNLILGPPSGRATSTATGAQNVSVKAWIPSQIKTAADATSHFYQVYRTSVVASGIDPGEEMQLVYQAYLTASDVANGYVTFTDATPDGLRGAALYTSPSQEGIAEANYAPPIAKDVAAFKGTVFYANTTSKHRARVQAIGTPPCYVISTGAGGITKSGGNGVYTFTGSPDLSGIPTDGTAYLSSTGNTSAGNNGDFPITAVDNVGKTITVTNAAAVTEAGTASSRAVATKLTIGGTNYYASLVAETTVAPYRYLTTTTSSQSNVDSTIKSLLRVLNQTHATVYGYYESGPDDGAGKVLLEEQSIGGSSFSMTAEGTVFANGFVPALQATSALTSQNDAASNRVYFSKPNQPEHVPLANYFDIGDRTFDVLRVVPLRDALLVFTEDGMHRITGDGSGFWSVSPADQTVDLFGMDCVTNLRNACYALTRLGIQRITESSVALIDDPVSDLTRNAVSFGWSTNCHLTASDLDGAVYAYLHITNPILPGNSVNRCLVYSVRTGAWSEAPVSAYGQGAALSDGNQDFYSFPGVRKNGVLYRIGQGPIGGGDARIYFEDTASAVEAGLDSVGHAEASSAHKYMATVTASNNATHTVTLTNGSYTPAVGTLIVDRNRTNIYRVTADNGGGNYTVALAYGSDTFAFSAGQVYVYAPITKTIEWSPFSAGDDGQPKVFREVSILLDPASTVTTASVSMYTEATTSTQSDVFTSATAPLPAGTSGLMELRCTVPPSMRKARRLSVVLTHNTAAEYVFIRGISYVFDGMDNPKAVT